MRRATLELLVDPVSQTPLQVETTDGDPVLAGMLSSDDRCYEITGGIPRLVTHIDADQEQTATSFEFKWGRRDTYESAELAEVARTWFLTRYGFGSVDEMRAHFGGVRRILDAGCGSGFSADLWVQGWEDAPEWVGIDISAAVDIARDRLGGLPHADFVQADVLQLPFADEAFDVAFAEGVLHHTPSTWDALASLVRVLSRGGEVCFYVYRKKSPVREFTDDYVRSLVSERPPDEAWEALRPLTHLGHALADLRTKIEVPEDVDVLGIPAGRYDIQRLVYWHFAKLFWNDRLSFDENLHVNFDWYHPSYAHRHTEDDVREACARLDLQIRHFDVDDSGYTVRAVRH
jgi:arsenite methyltransferase